MKKETTCPECGREPAIIHMTYGILPGRICRDKDRVELKRPPEFTTQTQTNRIQGERDKNSRDIIQPWTSKNKPNEDFVRNYPNRAKDYFTDEQLKAL